MSILGAKNYHIKKSSHIKMLGTHIQQDLKLDKEINSLTSNLHNRIYNLKVIKEYTDFNTRKTFFNAYVIGKLNYMLPLYSRAPQYLTDKLHKIIMSAARAAIGSYCFKKSISYILNKCKWLEVNKLIIYSSICLIYKVLSMKEPKTIIKLFKKKFSNRNSTKWCTYYVPKNENMRKKIHLFKGLRYFYKLPRDIQNAKTCSFKKKLNLYLQSTSMEQFDSYD